MTFGNFPGMLGLPEGRGRATPIFCKKKCFQNSGAAYDLERSFKNFSDIFGQTLRRGRVTPYFRKC